jgi:hypothetical protein
MNSKANTIEVIFGWLFSRIMNEARAVNVANSQDHIVEPGCIPKVSFDCMEVVDRCCDNTWSGVTHE